MYQKPFITKLHLVNFRSIRNAVIEFDNPLFLVGQNGTGKSNIIEAFAFLADCMTQPINSAISGRQRRAIRLEEGGRQESITLRVDFAFGDESNRTTGHYAFSLVQSGAGFVIVDREECTVTNATQSSWFQRHAQVFTSNIDGLTPAVQPNALGLPLIGGLEAFAPIVQMLSSMLVYQIKAQDLPTTARLNGDTRLSRDGSNLASALYYLGQQSPETLERLNQLLAAVAPTISSLRAVDFSVVGGNLERVGILHQVTADNGRQVTMEGDNLSDGTLRTLALLVGILQTPIPSLIVIEEPELAIHPGALDAIADYIELAATRTQVVITTHSPDLLDAKWIKPENIRVVNWDEGETSVSRLGGAPVKMLQEHLMGAGELMRANALDEEESTGSAVEPLFDEIMA